MPIPFQRRRFMQSLAASSTGLLLPRWTSAQGAPAAIAADSTRPLTLQGLQFGDPRSSGVIAWSRADRPARLIVEWSHDESMRQVRRIVGPYALEPGDFIARQEIAGFEPGQPVFVRLSFQGLDSARSLSAPVTGRFLAPPAATPGRHAAPVRFVWGGDTAGQGWGINPSFGGMKIYEAMRRRQPQFFVHSGDNIYADGPIQASVNAEGGAVWTNLVIPEVSKVAETLDEFRARYRYNLMDENLRRFNAEVPQIWQWDDHEVTNNWSDAKDVSGDARYREKSVPRLIAHGAQAFLEYAPMRPFDALEPQRVYRRFRHGPHVELFVLDMRSYRGPNSANLQSAPDADTAFLGREQLDWLKQALAQSTATWKVIAADMPIGLAVGDGRTAQDLARWEAVANGDPGAPKGRELEFAELLAHLKRRRVRNVVWLTADVHYCAAHYYDPAKAAFPHFDGFWEFVAGPLNAGTFGPNALDGTFGPQVVFVKAPPPGQSNLSPLAGLQFFGEVNVDAQGHSLTVDLRDLEGQSVYSRRLSAARG